MNNFCKLVAIVIVGGVAKSLFREQPTTYNFDLGDIGNRKVQSNEDRLKAVD